MLRKQLLELTCKLGKLCSLKVLLREPLCGILNCRKLSAENLRRWRNVCEWRDSLLFFHWRKLTGEEVLLCLRKDPDAGKNLREEEEGTTGWNGWMASPTQWTRVCASSGRWWRTGSLMCCSPCGHKVLDTTEWLNNNIGGHEGYPGGLLESTYQCKRHGFDPWVGRIPWRRKWQPIPILLPGESHGQRSLAGYILSMGLPRSWTRLRD